MIDWLIDDWCLVNSYDGLTSCCEKICLVFVPFIAFAVAQLYPMTAIMERIPHQDRKSFQSFLS